jgi:GDP-L-fucose synthase
MILVTGASGFLGNRVCKMLEDQGRDFTRTSRSLGIDLMNFDQLLALMREVKPDSVLNCAGHNGNIHFGMTYTGEIFRNNMLMVINLLEACRLAGVQRLINPIANCTYPSRATTLRESEFWDGPLHPSVISYGTVRKAATVGGYAYHHQYGLDVMNIVMSNMYGPGDHFDDERSHALGGLVMKAAKAKRENAARMEVWGTGRPIREWLFIDDGAEALIRGIGAPAHIEPFNVGIGEGVAISKLAQMIIDRIGFEGELYFDTNRPDGAPCKLMDGTLGAKVLGWQPSIRIEEGLDSTIDWYLNSL